MLRIFSGAQYVVVKNSLFMSLFLLAFMERIQGRTDTVMAFLIALAALRTLVVLLVVAAFATLCIKRLLSCTLGL